MNGGKGGKIGPDIGGVSRRRTDAWITDWLHSPEKMLQGDADARALLLALCLGGGVLACG